MSTRNDHGEYRELMIHDKQRVFFSGDFLVAPTVGWSVNWDASHADSGKCGVPKPGHERDFLAAHREFKDHGVECIRGTIVKCHNPHRVWVLTGKYDESSNGYEAVWPD